MKIESIIRRVNGTTVTLGDNTYTFQPESRAPGRPTAAAHVAEVTDPEHIDTLLAIPEGFRPAVDDTSDETAEDTAPDTRSHDELVAAYVQHFGRKPNSRLRDGQLAQLVGKAEAKATD